MTRRSKIWLVVAVLFTLVNFAGGVYALVLGELLHTVTHAGLVFLGGYWVRHLWRRAGESESPTEFHEFTDRLTHVEQSVEAVAIELERIGEGQRFITRLFTENATARVPGEGAAEPIEIKAR